jgi:hypothetical protein
MCGVKRRDPQRFGAAMGDWESEMFWVFCAILAIGAGFYVLQPLFREPKAALDIDLLAETDLDRLLDRKAVVYRNLKDLEFEYAMGRLTEEDFHRLQVDYVNDAATILGKLDQLGASENLDQTIEKDIASRKAKLFPQSPIRPQGAQRCPACGAEVITGKKFCADCGQRL